MNGRRGDRTTILLKIAGAAAVLGASKALFRDGDAPTGRHRTERGGSSDAGHSRRGDIVTYGVGYGLALLLTGAAFALVHWRWTSGPTALGLVFVLALAQAVVHFSCFLHVGLKRSSRDDLQLILFSSVIVCLMVGGTLVVLFNLRTRMM